MNLDKKKGGFKETSQAERYFRSILVVQAGRAQSWLEAIFEGQRSRTG